MSPVLKVLIILLTGNINGQRNKRNRRNPKITPYEFYGCSDFDLTESECNNACIEHTQQDVKFCTRRKYCCMLNAMHNEDYAISNQGYRHLGGNCPAITTQFTCTNINQYPYYNYNSQLECSAIDYYHDEANTNPNQINCVCDRTTDYQLFCGLDLSISPITDCQQFMPCQSDKDCPKTFGCISSCCNYPVCIPSCDILHKYNGDLSLVLYNAYRKYGRGSSSRSGSSDGDSSDSDGSDDSDSDDSDNKPTKRPSKRPTDRPTPIPTGNNQPPPTPIPLISTSTISPTMLPTDNPTIDPTARPSQAPYTPGTPSFTPTLPTAEPTPEPTNRPTTSEPTPEPTPEPTDKPTTSQPTPEPTPEPTDRPSPSPSLPSIEPTPQPTDRPSISPSRRPSAEPTPEPTDRPSVSPTLPTSQPTAQPTLPTAEPTPEPTPRPISNEPTPEPTPRPTMLFGALASPLPLLCGDRRSGRWPLEDIWMIFIFDTVSLNIDEIIFDICNNETTFDGFIELWNDTQRNMIATSEIGCGRLIVNNLLQDTYLIRIGSRDGNVEFQGQYMLNIDCVSVENNMEII